MKILIVDDSVFMRTVLRGILLKTRYKDAEVTEASNGEEAIEKYRAEKPDLMLLDIIMPGKDGIAVLKELGDLASPVIIISSVDQGQVIDEAKSLGAKGYIVKPYEADQVIEILNSLF